LTALTRHLTTKRQAGLHLALIVIALLLLPIIPDISWKPGGEEDPGLRILLLLAATIGLPYFLISTFSPLVQAWFSSSRPGASPYRLFALSNLASLLALMGYHFLIAPWITTLHQALSWLIGFAVVAMLIGALAWRRIRGATAGYGAKGYRFRFYEINPDVVTIARRDFTYLNDSAAKIEISLGDARLNLEREPPQAFDVFAIAAFSSDAIPIHLITREAVDTYEKHMNATGVIAIHATNRYFDLKPVVNAIAQVRGLRVAWIKETYNDGDTRSDWNLLAEDKVLLDRSEILQSVRVIPPTSDRRLWTDDFNNLLQALQ